MGDKKKLIIEDNQAEINIEEDCKIEGSLIIENNKAQIDIENCEIRKNLIVEGENKDISIFDSSISSILFKNDGSIESLCISTSKVGKIFILKNSIINHMEITDSFISNLLLPLANIKSCYLETVCIGEQTINGYNSKGSEYEGNNLWIIENKIIGDHSNNRLSFEGICFTKVEFKNFIGGNNISFVNCEVGVISEEKKKKFSHIEKKDFYDKSKNKNLNFKIEKSNLDKTQFHSFNIDKDTEVKIENSNLTDIIITNFPLLKNVESSDVDGQREVYRQLKYHASKQGDSYKALYYYEKEMSTLMKISKKGYDKILLYVGKYISNHGTNWLLVLLWIFVINIFLFILFLYSSGAINDILPTFSDILNTLNDLNNSFSDILNTLNDILNTLNNLFKYGYPLTKIEDLKKSLNLSSISPGSEFIFYLTKIINAVLLYHLIISFRKFNKKF